MRSGLEKVNRILIVKLRYIGDTILLLPVIENIKKYLPHVHLAVMVNKGTEEILKYSKNIDELICYDRKSLKHSRSFGQKLRSNYEFIRDIRRRHFDLVIDFSQSDRSSFLSLLSGAPVRAGCDYENPFKRIFFNRLIDADIKAMHIVDYELKALEQLGFPISCRELSIDIPDDVQMKIDRMLAASDAGRCKMKVVIHPGARRSTRLWVADRYGEIALRLKKEYGAAIILISGPNEGDLIRQIEVYAEKIDFKASDLTMMELAALLNRCDLYLGNDTAPAHLSAAVGIKSVTLFGPQFPFLWRPYSGNSAVVFKNLACCGCNQIDCIHGENICMTGISVDDVWAKIREVLGER